MTNGTPVVSPRKTILAFLCWLSVFAAVGSYRPKKPDLTEPINSVLDKTYQFEFVQFITAFRDIQS